MRLQSVRRGIALAVVFAATAGAGSAAAQTVVVRGLVPGAKAELIQRAGAAASGVADANGDATIVGGLTDPGETRVSLFVDTCEAVRRVVIVPRDSTAPVAGPSCTRAAIPGLFVIQPISTIVVNVAGGMPTVLLRQGPFDLSPPREWAASPTGLVVFGAVGFGKLHNVRGLVCASVEGCPGDDSAAAFAGGIGYWLTPYLAVEASYLKPGKSLFEGAAGNSLFQSRLEPHALNFVGKLGVPVGPVRLYGQGGATYHRALLSHEQDSVDGIEDRFVLNTAGWGWNFGGGIEIWVAPAFALYGQFDRTALKGSGVETGGEGKLDERASTVVFGLRVNLSR